MQALTAEKTTANCIVSNNTKYSIRINAPLLRCIFFCPVSYTLTMKTKDNLNIIKSCLPFSLRAAVDNIPQSAQEIRLRVNRPVVVQACNKTYYIDNNLRMSEDYNDNLLILSQQELSEAFSAICSYSVYSKQNEIINGFVTLKGGNRAGICGTAVVLDGKIINIRDITSINIRLSCEMYDCSDEVLNIIDDISGGVLLCGPPCSGKTTILRDVARKISPKYRTAIIDTRGELASVYGGIPQNDVGMSDVLNMYSKNDGFEHAVRCLSPEVIICDELSGDEDTKSVLTARKSGVAVLASAHCRDESELLCRPFLYTLIQTGCFETVVFLGVGENVGQVTKVKSADELL